MKSLLSYLFRLRKVRYNLIAGAHADINPILQQLDELGCELQNASSGLSKGWGKESSIYLAFVNDMTKSELEENYQKIMSTRSANIKFLIVSDCPLWKNRHDNKIVFNIPSATHSFEIARTMHYLSLVG